MTRHRGVSICRFRFLHGNLVFNCTVLSVQREYNTVQEELFYIYGPLVLLPPLIYDLGINYRYFNYYDGYSSRQQLGKSIFFSSYSSHCIMYPVGGVYLLYFYSFTGNYFNKGCLQIDIFDLRSRSLVCPT